MWVKLVIIVLLLVILGSLASALFFLLKDKGRSRRTVRALMLRVALSATAFLLLMAAWMAGLIQPHGVVPPRQPAATEPQNQH